MLSVDEALKAVLVRALPLAPRRTPAEDALGLILAEDVTSDIDTPPHDKSIVDGYAVVAASIDESQRRLRFLEEVTAGRLPTETVVPWDAVQLLAPSQPVGDYPPSQFACAANPAGIPWP